MTYFLKCDATGCSHVETVDAIVREQIGKPCPVCGASLLTEEDFTLFEKTVEPAIAAAEAAGLVLPFSDGHDGPVIEIHGHDNALNIAFKDKAPVRQ